MTGGCSAQLLGSDSGARPNRTQVRGLEQLDHGSTTDAFDFVTFAVKGEQLARELYVYNGTGAQAASRLGVLGLSQRHRFI
ncbi:MAG TPA: hypothetical protein VKR27_02580 [Acidimicrobiales bacterium]|nr:hypothetical protein [Acidimicrobiales bacterium]